MNDELSVRFYLKCVDDKGVVTTYRFNNDTALKQFVSTMGQHKLAIVDTHIACYGVELLTPAFVSILLTLTIWTLILPKKWYWIIIKK